MLHGASEVGLWGGEMHQHYVHWAKPGSQIKTMVSICREPPYAVCNIAASGFGYKVVRQLAVIGGRAASHK